MSKVFSYEKIIGCDLVVDAIYEGSKDGQLHGEPISKLLPGSGNMGGFRISGVGANKNWVILFTTGEDPDWPDSLDNQTGTYVYFGDNKKPGHDLHDTKAGGNKLIRDIFSKVHMTAGMLSGVPPFFIFAKSPTEHSARAVKFLGLAVPGAPGLSSTEDIVAIWKSTSGQRFQNYRAVFTVLDVASISREWISDLAAGNQTSSNAPKAWLDWVKTRKYVPLIAKPTTEIREVSQQIPDTEFKRQVLVNIWSHFKDAPVRFEAFAAKIYQMSDRRVIIDEITRGSVDGGRDAIGRYQLGLVSDPVFAEFSLEAKCYQPALSDSQPNTVGVKEVSRLISRIRHRQFGVLVTTSVISRQAYKEVREDNHPIIFICGKDIVEILIANGYNGIEKIAALLSTEFPMN